MRAKCVFPAPATQLAAGFLSSPLNFYNRLDVKYFGSDSTSWKLKDEKK
jgi:hypothetical protein